MSGHLDDAALNDYVDGRLPTGALAKAAAHLLVCRSCGARQARLMALLEAATDLREGVEPPAGAWDAIRERLDDGRVVAIGAREPGEDGPDARGAREGAARGVERSRSGRRGILVAAGLLIAVLSSGLTIVALRGRDGASRIASRPAPAIGASSPARAPRAALPTLDARVLDAEYTHAVAELDDAWRGARAPLAPATAAALDSSLRAVDQAIAEIRAAAVRSPGDPLLADILGAAYRRKLDLLRRALALPAHT